MVLTKTTAVFILPSTLFLIARAYRLPLDPAPRSPHNHRRGRPALVCLVFSPRPPSLPRRLPIPLRRQPLAAAHFLHRLDRRLLVRAPRLALDLRHPLRHRCRAASPRAHPLPPRKNRPRTPAHPPHLWTQPRLPRLTARRCRIRLLRRLAQQPTAPLLRNRHLSALLRPRPRLRRPPRPFTPISSPPLRQPPPSLSSPPSPSAGVFRIASYLRHPDYTFLNAAQGVTRLHRSPPRPALASSSPSAATTSR